MHNWIVLKINIKFCIKIDIKKLLDVDAVRFQMFNFAHFI